MAFKKNYTVVGNPTISNDFIASGFSDNDYITTESPFIENMESFEIGTHFTLNALNISNQGLLDTKNADEGRTFRLTVSSDNKIVFRAGSSNSSDDYFLNLTGTTVLQTDTEYWVKASYNSASGYSVKLSTDGLEYSNEASSTTTEIFPIPTSLTPIYIGDNVATGASLGGSIYLKDTYININDQETWRAVKDVGIIPGSVTISKGYYNADGTNIIKFTEDITKTLTEASGSLGYKNNIVLTLDNSINSSFIVQGINQSITNNEYIVTKILDGTSVYLNNSKKIIKGPEPEIGNIESTINVGSPATSSKEWTRPNLTSATSYGIVSDSRNNSSEAGWVALDGNNSTNFVPNQSAGWWKWELPVTLKFTENSSVITWVHRNNTEVMSGSDTLQFFADEECTIPLTNTFADPSSSNATVDLPVVGNIETNIIYLKIKTHSGWGGAAEIKFTNVQEAGSDLLTGSVTFSAGYKYINEDVGVLDINTDTTKTLDQLIFPDDSKSEQMYLNLFISDTGVTDFFLTSSALTNAPTGYRYFEQVGTLYLDKTLSYIYGTEPQQLGEDEVLVTLNVPEGSNVLIYDEDNNTLFENTI